MKAAMSHLALRNRDNRRSVALLFLGLFLVLQIFSASSGLHQSLHRDATSPSHHCVITLFAQGHVSAAVGAVGVAAIMAAFLFLLPPLRTAILSSLDYQLAPGRAPPRF